MAPRLPLRARQYLEGTKLAPATEVALGTGVTEYDVNFPAGTYAALQCDVAPWAMPIGWITTIGIEYLPGKSNFREGYRVALGGPAPAGAKLCHGCRVTP